MTTDSGSKVESITDTLFFLKTEDQFSSSSFKFKDKSIRLLLTKSN